MPAIVAFLDSNYGDQDLSLAMVADKFNISVPYLSSLFKTSAGVNFSNYVEGVRIEKAKGLLKNTSMTVGEIASFFSSSFSAIARFLLRCAVLF